MLKPKIRSDYRILLTKYATIGVFLIAGVSCSIAPIAADDKIWSWMVLSLYPLAVFLCLLFTRRDPSAALLFSILSAFIGVAYFLKFSLMLHYPDLVWGAGRVIDTSRVVENILPLMYALAPALFLYLVGLGIGPRLSVSPQFKLRYRFGMKASPAIAICVLLLLVKLVALLFFDVGSPIRKGTGLPPLILAVLEFLCQDAMLVGLNVLLYGAIHLKRYQFALAILVAILLNVVISLSAGWKGEMVIQAFVFVYLGFEFRSSLGPTARKRAFRGAVVGLIVMVLVYPLVNDYRRKLNRTDSVSAAFENRAELDTNLVGEGSTVVEIFRRVSGISTYYASLEVAKNESLGLSALWDGETGRLMKRAVFGGRTNQVIAGFGSSQFATLFLIGGSVALYVGSFLFGIFTRGASWLMARFIFRYYTSFQSVLPLLALSWVSMMLGGGNLNLKIKELFVVCCLVVAIERLVFFRKVPLPHDVTE